MNELKGVFCDGKVMTCDMNPEMAPACVISDGCFRVPRCSSEDYIETLLTLCIEKSISIVIPTIDTELAILSANKDVFAKQGIQVLVSDYDFVMTCLDKRMTSEFFSKNLILMDYIEEARYKEFTVDMYYGRDNKVKSIVPRERLKAHAGEINQGITRKNYIVGYLKERMDYLPGVIGCICIQLFYREQDNNVVAFEINPRFGGGYPLSYGVGANFPKMIIEEYLLGKTFDYSDDWHDNTLMLRYDDEVIVYGDKK